MFRSIQTSLGKLFQRHKIGLIKAIVMAIQLQLGSWNQADGIEIADVTVLELLFALGVVVLYFF